MILLIDRDPDTRSILRSALEWNGYEVLEASDAVAGLRMVRTVAARLIIMEHPLLVEGGPTLLHAVREGPRTAALPILVTTATGGPETVAQALELGCDVVLVKPFLPSRALEEARRLLDASGSRAAGAGMPPIPPAAPIGSQAESRSTPPDREARVPMNAIERGERDPQVERMERESFIVLQHLYTITDGNPKERILCSKLSSDLGLMRAETAALLGHLGSVELVSSAEGSVAITRDGTDYIERLAWRRRTVRK